MNSCLLILLLLCCCKGGYGLPLRFGCGCGGNASSRAGRSRASQDSCPCGDAGARGNSVSCADAAFEPRFDQRPFHGNGSACGCEGEGN